MLSSKLTEQLKLELVTDFITEIKPERGFIEALEQMDNDTRNLSIKKALVDNKLEYLLKIRDCMWEIEPHVLLDAQYGLSVQLSADYVLWPLGNSPGQRPVVIFIDNFFNHKDKVADDTLKREAIRRSNSFRVWSLSWKDLQDVFEDQGDYATTTLVPENRSFGAQLYRKAAEKKNVQILHPDKVGIFELLVQYLENKDAEELFTAHAKAFAFALLNPRNINNRLYFSEWKYLIEPIIENLEMREAHFELSNTMFDIWSPRSSDAHLTILAGAALTEIQKYQRHAEVTVCALLNDVLEERTDNYEAEWNGFWHFFNMMQFLSNFAAVSVNGMEQMIYNKIPAAV